MNHGIGPHGVMPKYTVLNTNTSEFTKNATATTRYRATENPWGRGSLVRGVDFTDSVSVNNASFPSGVQFDWSWPVPGTGAVMSFPFDSYETVTAPYPAVSSLTTIQSTHAITYQLNGQAAIMYDTWLATDSSDTVTAFEIQYWVATRGYTSALTQTFRSYGEPYITLASPAVDVYEITGGGWPRLFIFPVAAQSNKFDNPTMSGSSAGTPGTLPTHVSINNNDPTHVSTSVGSAGNSTAPDGTSVDWFDLRIFGTPSSTTNLGVEFDDPAGSYFAWNPTTDGNGFAGAYLAVQPTGTGLTNFSDIQFGFNGYDSGFGYLATTGGLNLALTGDLQHFGLQYVPTSAAVARLQLQLLFWFTAGQPIDITIRIGNVAVSKDPTQIITSQTFDWKQLFTSCTSAGIMAGTECLTTIQFGPEIENGSGTVSLSSFNVVQA